jgi:hypothetical protein
MSSQSWTEREWINPPLGVALKNYLKSVDWDKHHLGVKVRVMRRNSGKLWQWSLCCLLLLRHDNLHHSFRDTLSKTQLGSFSNLLEWWTGKYQDARLSAAAIAYIVLESALKLPKDEAFRRIAAKLSKSCYHYQLFHLFCLEFSVDRKPAVCSIFPEGLMKARESAALYACTQRIGCTCYQAAVRKYQQRLGETNEPKPKSNVTEFGGSIACALTDIITRGSVGIDDAQERLKIPLYVATVWPYELGQVMESVLLTPAPKFGAVSEPCWWLTAAEKDGLPYYLWDVANERTVETAGLKSPSYTAISHTWGRWRETREDYMYAQVKGVEWLVPRNSLFCVEDLPRILKNVPREGNYVWLDLVCIPQDAKDPKLIQITNHEIARQAKIFSTASRAVAWFSNIDSMDGLKSVARWLAFSLVEHPAGGRRRDFNPLDEETRHVQNSSTVLAQVAGEVGSIDLKTLPSLSHGWLSSLWTFQEACLRPDMWICGKDWTALRLVDGDVRSTLELSGLMALVQQVSEPRVTGSSGIIAGVTLTESLIRMKCPRSLVVLASVMMLSGMPNIFQPVIEDILWQGSNRHCQEKRSEAIMSVVGVTDWEGRAQHKDLVLGKYSLAFIEKVRKRWGSTLFFSFSVEVDSGGLRRDSGLVGTMLPFTAHYGAAYMHTSRMSSATILEHDSVAKWEIQKNGSVRIRDAAIIACSKSTIGKPMSAIVTQPAMALNITEMQPLQPLDHESQIRVDLPEWIRSKLYECYAVCTGYSHTYVDAHDQIGWSCEGIILKKVPHVPEETSDFPSGYFVKFAKFSVSHDRMMQIEDLNPSTEVNWVVL